MKDKLSTVRLEPSDTEPKTAPLPKPQRNTKGDDDIDFAEWFHNSDTTPQAEVQKVEVESQSVEGDSSQEEWLNWAGTEVERLPEHTQTPHLSDELASTKKNKLQPPKADSSAQQKQEQLLEERATWEAESSLLKEELATLQETNTTLKQKLANAKEDICQLKDRAGRYRQERDDARQEKVTQVTVTSVLLTDLLLERGVPTGRTTEALTRLAASGAKPLLSQLQMEAGVGKELLKQYLALCCDHEDCVFEMEAAVSSRALLPVSNDKDCENCQGSDNRRSFRRMIRTCREHRRYKLVVVGGSPDAHTEIQLLAPEGFDIKLISGKDRRNKQQATDDLRYGDLVIVWGPTILPHKISELYTKQKELFPDRVVVIHKRGVASLARDVSTFLESL